jgi:septum formation topological specificity factor MinE
MLNLIARRKLNRRITLIGCSCLLVFQVTVLSPVQAAEADSRTDAEERLDAVIAEHRYQHERNRLDEKSNDCLAEFVIRLFIPDRITIHANVFSEGGSFARTPAPPNRQRPTRSAHFRPATELLSSLIMHI